MNYLHQSILVELKQEISELLAEKKKIIDEYDINALFFIIKYLDELIYEYQTNRFKSKDKRYKHISRILIDRNTSLISVITEGNCRINYQANLSLYDII